MAKYIGDVGLTALIQSIKSLFATKKDVEELSDKVDKASGDEWEFIPL